MADDTAPQAPRRRRITNAAATLPVELTQQFPDDPEDEFSDEPETAQDRVSSLMDSVGEIAGGVIMVYKQTTTGREYCGRFTPEQFENNNLDLLRDTWGPGEYALDLRGKLPSGNNKVGLIKRAVVKISPPIMGANLPNQPQASTGLEMVLSKMVESQQKTNEMLAAMANKPQQNNMESMRDVLTTMTLFREAMGLTGGAPAQKSSIGELVDGLREIKALSGDLGLSEKSDADESLVSQAMPIIRTAVDAFAQRQNNPVQQIQTPASFSQTPRSLIRPTQAPAQSATQTYETSLPSTHADSSAESDDMPDMALMAQLFYINQKAKEARNEDGTYKPESVEPVAQYLAEKMPEDMIAIMETPTWFEFLTHHPSAQPLVIHKEWLTAVRDRALVLLYEEDRPESEIPGGGHPPL